MFKKITLALFLFFIFYFSCFAAVITLGTRTFADHIDKGTDFDSADLNKTTEFGLRFSIGDWGGLSALLNLNTGVGVGEKRIKGEFIITIEGAVSGEVLETEKITINEKIPELLFNLEFNYGLQYKKEFLSFINPFIAAGIYNGFFIYNTAEIVAKDITVKFKGINRIPNTLFDWDIEAVQENITYSSFWYAYGVMFDITNVLLLGLEYKKNNADNFQIDGKSVNLSSETTSVIFNLGF